MTSGRVTLQVSPDEWLMSETPEDVAAWLRDFDAEELPERSHRLYQVLELFASRSPNVLAGGEETLVLAEEARDAYTYGLPVASLLASHAACERHLAGMLSLLTDTGRTRPLPEGWERFGLGRLVEEAAERRVVDDHMADRLRVLVDRRKMVGHFKRPLASGGWTRRLVEAEDLGVLSAADQDPKVQLLLSDAYTALGTMLDLLLPKGGAPSAWPV